jgi:triphosphatase
MTEFELKLEVQADRAEAVEAAVRNGPVVRQRLLARYFDTPDRALAARGVVVRLRKEGAQWVQTAKAPGDRPLERLEHNVDLTGRATPQLDLARHDGAPVGERIRRALKLKPADAFPALEQIYQTDITRLSRLVSAGEASVEIAWDSGRISANTSEGKRSLPVHELELELKQGSPANAVELARYWCQAHGLWLSSVSKSMKGQRLAENQPFGAAVSAQAPRFGRHASGRAMASAVLASCLDQVLANASDVAGGCSDAEHIHQLRVGLRRLRTALRELGALIEGVDSAWEAPIVALFRALGEHRDRDYLLHTVQGQMTAAGGPPLNWRAALTAKLPDTAAAVRSPAFQEALIGLIGLVHAASVDEGMQPDPPAKKTVRRRLAKLHKDAISEGRHFLELEEAMQHRLRKRLKRLRYLAEFSRPLFAKRQVDAFVEALKPVQDALGDYNDELAALKAWQHLVSDDARAWFGCGWLSARRPGNELACLQACETFARDAKPFWD